MPLDLRQLQNRRAELSVSIDGESEPLTFSFYPHKFTNATNNRITGSPGLNTLVDELAGLLIDWNLLLDGQPFPLSKENLSLLGLPVLTAMAKAIVARVTGQDADGETARKNSASGPETPAAASAPSPTGSP